MSVWYMSTKYVFAYTKTPVLEQAAVRNEIAHFAFVHKSLYNKIKVAAATLE